MRESKALPDSPGWYSMRGRLKYSDLDMLGYYQVIRMTSGLKVRRNGFHYDAAEFVGECWRAESPPWEMQP